MKRADRIERGNDNEMSERAVEILRHLGEIEYVRSRMDLADGLDEPLVNARVKHQ